MNTKQDFMKLYYNGAFEIARMPLSGESMSILLFLFGKCSYENIINVSRKELAEELDMEQQVVDEAIKELLDHNILLPGPKDSEHDTYRLNHVVASRGFASFDEYKYKPLGKQKPKKKASKKVMTAG